MIRLLRQGDEGELERFLAPLADSSMFLLANARKGGLEDQGQGSPMVGAQAKGTSGVERTRLGPRPTLSPHRRTRVGHESKIGTERVYLSARTAQMAPTA